jgi:YHS domain-containing protein/uncharacterized membrane protein YraQ (UPF0718 family)
MHLAAIAPLVDVGRSLREGFFMFWETLWALVLGFTLSGVVQAFVSKEQMQAKLGNHRPAAVGRAAGYGMVSSSCSYAASSMAKSLFAKGADFVAAMVFMIASTNLVVELGIVMLVLLGWQFMAAEFVGGPIMLILLAMLGGFVFRSALVEAARRRLAGDGVRGHDHAAMTGVSPERQDELERSSLPSKMRSPAAWSDAASYAVADVTMLRRELVIGYVVAGFLAVLVPNHVWNVLFVHGHGFWTSLENALVGPIIAVLSWVCSIGNVPLAAALWSGGISFGGVISFVFADLIAMPLILIYRKFYGTKLTLRLVGLFYVLMATAGLVTEGIFRLFQAVPTTRSLPVTSAHFEWNYTTFLDIVFLAVGAGVWWLARNKKRFGGGEGYATDPVCGMQVRTADAPATAVIGGTTHYFCSDRCHSRYIQDQNGADPTGRRITGLALTANPSPEPPGNTTLDPVCGMTVDPGCAAEHREYEGVPYWFCSRGCAQSFDANPTMYRRQEVSP